MIPDAFLALDYMLDRFAWLVEGLVVRARADAPQPRGEPRPLLQPARCCSRSSSRASTRDEAYRLVQRERDARVGRGARLPRARPRRRRDRRARRPRRRLRPRRVHPPRRHRLRAPRTRSPPKEEPFMSEAVHVGSRQGARALRARRRAPAARRERPHLDLRRRPADRDPGQGPRAHRPLGFWFARTREIVPNHLLALRDDGRSIECRRLEMLPIECVVRGYLAGSGWKDYQATGARLRARAARGPASSRSSCREPIFTPATKAQTGPRREHHRDQAAELVGAGALRARSSASRSSSTASRPTTRAERGIILADTKFELGLDADGTARARRRGADAGLVALLAGRRVRARAARQPSFDKQFVRDYCETLGWDKTAPGPELPDEVVARHARDATSRRSSG